jgi:hypothetical protein
MKHKTKVMNTQLLFIDNIENVNPAHPSYVEKSKNQSPVAK